MLLSCVEDHDGSGVIDGGYQVRKAIKL